MEKTVHLNNTHRCSVSLYSSQAELRKALRGSDFFIIEKTLFNTVQGLLPHKHYLVCQGGEQCKNTTVFTKILKSFFNASLFRTSSVAVIGGGALCDVGSYAASVYMRGVSLKLFPTSLLAMVDASIGGKTAVNFDGLKNMVGTFYPASNVYIFPHFLLSLPPKEMFNGLAEILKAGMLYNKTILQMFEEQKTALLQPYNNKNKTLWHTLIWDAAKVKMYVVEKDFDEKLFDTPHSSTKTQKKVSRSFLNLGHSFAHAIEAEAQVIKNKSFYGQHGRAVALGLRSALLLGQQLGITNSNYCKKIVQLLNSYGYKEDYKGFQTSSLIEHIKKDKKNTSSSLRFVLQKNICNTVLADIAEKHVSRVLTQLGAEV